MHPPALQAALLIGTALALAGCTAAGQGERSSQGQGSGQAEASQDSGQGAGQPPVLPAEQVFAAAPVVETDPSGTRATLRVTTELDMACAVVYGRDASLGDGIATDADMGGGAHAEHVAVMTGLRPGTRYLYRVQGSGADGNLYRSELLRFTTPRPGPAAAPPGPNAAQGALVVSASSQFSEAFAAGNAVDGDLSTEWSTAGDGDDASITLDLGRPLDVVGMALRSRAMADGSSVIETYTVTVDGGETLGPFDAGTDAPVADVDVTGQVLRIDAERTTGGNTGAAEIEVYRRP